MIPFLWLDVLFFGSIMRALCEFLFGSIVYKAFCFIMFLVVDMLVWMATYI